MADLNRALELLKSLDLEQLERLDQIDVQEAIQILDEMVAGGEDTAEPESGVVEGGEPETEETTDPPEGQTEEVTDSVEGEELEVDSAEVTVDSVMEERLEEETKEVLKDVPK